MTDTTGRKRYDLEPRTRAFAKRVRSFVRRLPRTFSNAKDVEQLVRSSGSVGANYIEANNALGKKDFLMHIRISLKEAKESGYWLDLLNVGESRDLLKERDALAGEATELMKIFGAILRKSL